MASFGFTRQSEQGSVTPEEVGRLLRSRGQAGPVDEKGASPSNGNVVPPSIEGGGQLRVPLEDQMRAVAGALRGGVGQPPSGPLTEHSPSATNAAIGGALSNLGNGGNPGLTNLRSPQTDGALRRHGMSTFEIEILKRTGVI